MKELYIYLFGVITDWWGFCDNEQWWERGQRNILDKGWIWALNENLIFFLKVHIVNPGWQEDFFVLQRRMLSR